ncbi:MAG: TonB-dependent receptor plug domain-containing protein [Gemmatimonadaceae bacterium]
MLTPLAVLSAQVRSTVVSIRDSVTQQPLAGVLVARDSGGAPIGTTDSAGIARITLRDATKRFYLSRLGYAPRWLPLSDASSLSLDVLMSPAVLTLSGVSVEAKPFPHVPERLREFEERRASQRSAVFFTRTDIVKRNTNWLTDLFRGISSVKVVDSAGVRAIASARSVLPRINSTGTSELRYCLLRVVLDGQPKESGYPLDQLEPNDIYGVEVYVGPSTVPSQYAAFGRDANCGVILLWTR